MKTFSSILILLSATNVAKAQEFGRILAKGGKYSKNHARAKSVESDLSMGFEELGLDREMSMEYVYAGKSEQRGAKASKYNLSMEFAAAHEMSTPFVLIRSKSHKNIFGGDGAESSEAAMSLEYIPVVSKSSKIHKEEDLAAAATLSMDFIPYSSKGSKPSSKAPVDEEDSSTDDTPVPASKSAKSIAIAPRSITLGEESDSQISEVNSEANGDDARKMSAASIAAVGAMLFL